MTFSEYLNFTKVRGKSKLNFKGQIFKLRLFCRSPFLLDFQAFKVPHFESGHPVLLPGGGWTKIALSHGGRGGQGQGSSKDYRNIHISVVVVFLLVFFWGGGGTVLWIGFCISWESRCYSEMKVWGNLCKILVVFEGDPFWSPCSNPKWKGCLEIAKTTKVWQRILKFSIYFRVYMLIELFVQGVPHKYDFH